MSFRRFSPSLIITVLLPLGIFIWAAPEAYRSLPLSRPPMLAASKRGGPELNTHLYAGRNRLTNESLLLDATSILWSNASTGGAWLTATNWTGSSTPNATQTAQFGINPTSSGGATVGINFANTTNAGTQTNGLRVEEVGAISLTSARIADLLIGNSSSTAGAIGTLRPVGVTVNGQDNVIIRNAGSGMLTIQNTQGSGNQTMALELVNPVDNVINIDGTGGITISSVITGVGKTLTVNGSGFNGSNNAYLTLLAANTYSGDTIIRGTDIISLTGAGSIAQSPVIDIGGGAGLDVRSRTSALVLSNGQSIKASGTSSSGKLLMGATKGLTTAANSSLIFSAFNGTTAPLTVSGAGTFALQSANTVTVTVANSGIPLGIGDYKLIAKSGTASVGITTPASVIVDGDGIASGTDASLVNISGELFLHVVESPGTLLLSSATYSVNEGTGNATITVNRTAGSAGAISVNYSTSNGTAFGGSSCAGSVDYISQTGTLTWVNGETAGKTFSIPVCNDSIEESSESVNIALSSPIGGAVLGGQNTAVLTITDNDAVTADFASASYSVSEGTPSVTLTVVRGGDSSKVFDIDYVTANSSAIGGTCGSAGSDYQTVASSIHFGIGEVTKTIGIPICTDEFSESPAEAFTVGLSNATNGVSIGLSTSTVTVYDAATEFMNTDPLQASGGMTVSNSLSVSGYQGNISGMRVTLFGVNATIADDLDVLLVDPLGNKYALVGDVGGASSLNNMTLTLEDGGSAGYIPDSGTIGEGQNYKPTNCESPVTDFAGSPAGAIAEPGCGVGAVRLMSETFGGHDPDGVWTLYIRNDAGAAAGVSTVSVAGWGIQFLAPTAAPVSVEGRVTDADGRGIPNAAVTIAGGVPGKATSTRTSLTGHYRFDGLEPAGTYIVSVRSRRYRFAAAARVVTLMDDLVGVDFMAEPEGN